MKRLDIYTADGKLLATHRTQTYNLTRIYTDIIQVRSIIDEVYCRIFNNSALIYHIETVAGLFWQM